MRLKDKVVIITGGSSGIGFETTKLFIQHGAIVQVFDIAISAELQELMDQSENVYFTKVDVTNEENVKESVHAVYEQFGKIDVLFNNAGISGVGKMHEVDLATWHKVMEVNVTGVYLMSKYVVEKMLYIGGNIINMSSCIAEIGLENRALYAASKGAVLSLTKSMQVDYAANNIRVNAILPGTIYTPFVKDYLSKSPNPEVALEEVKRRQLTSNLGLPEYVAEAALFLASEESKFMMGSPLYIDGGVTFGKKTNWSENK